EITAWPGTWSRALAGRGGRRRFVRPPILTNLEPAEAGRRRPAHPLHEPGRGGATLLAHSSPTLGQLTGRRPCPNARSYPKCEARGRPGELQAEDGLISGARGGTPRLYGVTAT